MLHYDTQRFWEKRLDDIPQDVNIQGADKSHEKSSTHKEKT